MALRFIVECRFSNACSYTCNRPTGRSAEEADPDLIPAFALPDGTLDDHIESVVKGKIPYGLSCKLVSGCNPEVGCGEPYDLASYTRTTRADELQECDELGFLRAR
jgi:hypothetical protein